MPSGGTGYTYARILIYQNPARMEGYFSSTYVYVVCLSGSQTSASEIHWNQRTDSPKLAVSNTQIIFDCLFYIFLYNVFIFKSMCMFIWSLVSVTRPIQSLGIMIDGWVTCCSTSKHTWNHQPLMITGYKTGNNAVLTCFNHQQSSISNIYFNQHFFAYWNKTSILNVLTSFQTLRWSVTSLAGRPGRSLPPFRRHRTWYTRPVDSMGWDHRKFVDFPIEKWVDFSP